MDSLKRSIIEIVYSEAARTGKLVFCIVDDTIASKAKPSSWALNPIEDAYFHQSHLKGKQDYGHQAVAVMLPVMVCPELCFCFVQQIYFKNRYCAKHS